MELRIFDSATRLQAVLEGRRDRLLSVNIRANLDDTPHTMYNLGPMRDTVFKSEGNQYSEEFKQRILSAEKDSRVFWRKHIDAGDWKNMPRFLDMLQAIRDRGYEVPRYELETISPWVDHEKEEWFRFHHHQVFWNVPAMRRWFLYHGIPANFMCRI